jgi:hypothetical protein
MAKNTIKIKKYADIIEEMTANAAITPGMLVEEMSTGNVRAHANAGQTAIPMFALEDELQGNGIDDDYVAGDVVQVWVAGRGDNVNALLADGESVVIGDFLESNGDGKLRKHTAESAGGIEYPQSIVGAALEALDLTGSSGEETTYRLQIRVI